jgi:hypothetical protein
VGANLAGKNSSESNLAGNKGAGNKFAWKMTKCMQGSSGKGKFMSSKK